jgi:hypothetical protein
MKCCRTAYTLLLTGTEFRRDELATSPAGTSCGKSKHDINEREIFAESERLKEVKQRGYQLAIFSNLNYTTEESLSPT